MLWGAKTRTRPFEGADLQAEPGFTHPTPYASRANTRWRTLGFRPGSWPQGESNKPTSSSRLARVSLVGRPNPRWRVCQRSPSPSSRGLLAGLPLRVARAPHCFVGGHGAPAQVAPASELGHAAAQPPSECSPDRHLSTRHHLLSAEGLASLYSHMEPNAVFSCRPFDPTPTCGDQADTYPRVAGRR